MLHTYCIPNVKKHSKICPDVVDCMITNQYVVGINIIYIGFYTRNSMRATFFMPKLWEKNNHKFYLHTFYILLLAYFLHTGAY